MNDALVLYSGGGGSTRGLHEAGYRTVGIDWDRPSCATHAAAGYPTIRADIETWPRRPFPGLDMVWASPPCQDWSTAGRKAGVGGDRNGWPATLTAVDVLRPRLFVGENVTGMTNRKNRFYVTYILTVLATFGYDAQARVLVASDYGLPQTRSRLFIVARKDGAPVWPAGTHAAYRPRHHRLTKRGISEPELFGEPWIPAAVVLGDGIIDRRMGNAPITITTTPAPTMTASSFGKSQWIIPSRTVAGNRAPRWMYDRPAIVVVGDPRVTEPGHHDPNIPNSHHDDLRWGIEQAAALQGFPPDWPWQGNKTQVHRQIGNAVPPVMARVLALANRHDPTG